MGGDGIDKRRGERRHAADPAGQGGSVEVDALAGVDHGLAVQRLRIGIFGDHHVGEQPRAWPASFDREGRQRRLHNGLAGSAAHRRPHVLNHFEGGRHVFQHFGDDVIDLTQHRAAAGRAGRQRIDDHPLARQMLRQWLAPVRCAVALQARIIAGSLGLCLARGDAFLELAEQELELLDLAVELLGGAAELLPAQPRKSCLQMLDLQRLGIELRVAKRDDPLLLVEPLAGFRKLRLRVGKHALQLDNVLWQIGTVPHP
jgi:hypothetical protein